MRVIFCGNPAFAVPTLRALINSPAHAVVAAVCSPDKPRGRGQKVEPLPVKQVALEAGLPVFQPVSLKDEEFLTRVRELRPDCLVVVAFRILPRELFALPRLGSFNVHPSLLPKGRGPAPIRWTLIRGETETGVSIIQLTEQVDAGGILLQRIMAVDPTDDFGTLHDRLSQMGAQMLLEVLDAVDGGRTLAPIAQDESSVTKAPKLFTADRILKWDQPAVEIVNRIRALSPAPGALGVAGNFRLKILQAQTAAGTPDLVPGGIFPLNGELHVGTGNGAVRLNFVQPEGRKPMKAADYLRGRPDLPAKFD